jgi:tRNA(Ile)-lysidine synthase TilS/MesJ
MKSISKNKHLWPAFIRAVDQYHLIDEGDKIAVCVSGGKDSFALALCMQELCRQSRLAQRQNFEVIFLCMDPGYNAQDRAIIEATAQQLNIPLEFFETNIFEVVTKAGGTPCYLCARMRRGNLYAAAQARGCNKIALAHHMDDIAETIMMNLMQNAQVKTMPVKVASKNFPGMTLIRPFCLERERDIVNWRDSMELNFIHCGCPLGQCENTGKRQETKNLLKQIESSNNVAVLNIFKALDRLPLPTDEK